MGSNLRKLIEEFERSYPGYEWTIARRKGRYLASSSPVEYVAILNGPNPDVVRHLGTTIEEAFSGMVLRRLRKDVNAS